MRLNNRLPRLAKDAEGELGKPARVRIRLTQK
jgi:hypothetical protein